MSKRNPLCEEGWHTTGTLKVLPTVKSVARRLEADKRVLMHEFNPSIPGGWWSYDAVWATDDGARVRARVQFHDQHPNEPADPGWESIPPMEYDPEATPLKGFFNVYAVADRPWKETWPSPLGVFLAKKDEASYATLSYDTCNNIGLRGAQTFGPHLQTLSSLPCLVTVFTHDDGWARVRLSDETLFRDTPLIPRLPASLHGRVLDCRIHGEETRQKLNKSLARYGAELPRGGAAIVLSAPRRKGIPASELSFPMTPAFTEGGNITPLVESLVKLFRAQIMEVDKGAMEELEERWTLFTPEESESETITELAAAKAYIEEQNARIDGLTELLEGQQAFLGMQNEVLLRTREVLAEAESSAEVALQGWAAARGELEDLQQATLDGDLGRALQEAVSAQEEAEGNAEAAEELLDEQHAALMALRQENDLLRRELARSGGTFAELEEAVEAEAAQVEPGNWDDLLVWARTLDHVVLGNVESEIDKLRGYEAEKAFIHRSWEALRSLEDYARLKKEAGADALPHFRAYLERATTGYLIPRTRYSTNESKSVLMNGRMVAARTLPVPRQVSESGRILMEAHIRIGSGKPPAPRMHFHDDTSGETGKIYVGHLGPHLLNYQSA